MHISCFRGPFRFLSNFWGCDVILDGVHYSCIENAYQAAKTLDTEQRKQFQDCRPGMAKRLGKSLKLRPDWDQVKLGVMERLIEQKFARGSVLAKQLLDTGSVMLVEGNTWNDTFWGVCNGRGSNHLGHLLMKRRTELMIQK